MMKVKKLKLDISYLNVMNKIIIIQIHLVLILIFTCIHADYLLLDYIQILSKHHLIWYLPL